MLNRIFPNFDQLCISFEFSFTENRFNLNILRLLFVPDEVSDGHEKRSLEGYFGHWKVMIKVDWWSQIKWSQEGKT